MSTAFDSLVPCTFAGFTFPIQKINIKGGIRDHVHEFPHTDGGAVEKLGRKLYDVTVSAVFSSTFPKYPNLWPDTLQELWQYFETSVSAYLTIPTIGSMYVYAVDWDRGMSAENLSGESMEITFREDSSGSNYAAILSLNTSNLESATDLLNETPFYAGDAPTTGLFTQLQNAVNSVLAVQDTADVYTALVVSKIESVVSLCSKIDALATFNNPTNAAVIDAMHDVWAAAVAMKATAITTAGGTNSGSLATYVTPRVMSISEVSSSLFGDTTHATDILQMNAISDAMSIPVRTSLLYFTV